MYFIILNAPLPGAAEAEAALHRTQRGPAASPGGGAALAAEAETPVGRWPRRRWAITAARVGRRGKGRPDAPATTAAPRPGTCTPRAARAASRTRATSAANALKCLAPKTTNSFCDLLQLQNLVHFAIFRLGWQQENRCHESLNHRIRKIGSGQADVLNRPPGNQCGPLFAIHELFFDRLPFAHFLDKSQNCDESVGEVLQIHTLRNTASIKPATANIHSNGGRQHNLEFEGLYLHFGCEFQHFRHIHIQPLATYSGGHHAYGIKLSGGQKLDVIFKPGKAPYQKNGFKYKNQVILTFAARTIEKPSSPRPRPPS